MVSRQMFGLLLLAGVMMMAAGCDSGGMADGPQSFDSSAYAAPFDGGSDEGDTTTEIAKVHNPEPASMALFGLGLFGLLRKRRKV
jgi:hypothetical protein